MRQYRAVFVQHFEHQFVPGLETNFLGHAGLGATSLALGPVLGQEEPEIDQRMVAMRDVAEVDANLAILDLAEPSAPLPLNAHRLHSLFGEG